MSVSLTKEQRGERTTTDAPTRTPVATEGATGTPTIPEASPDALGEAMIVHVVDARGRSVPAAEVFRLDQPEPTGNSVALRLAAEGSLDVATVLRNLGGQTLRLQLESGTNLTWGVSVQASDRRGDAVSIEFLSNLVPPDDGAPPRLLPLGQTDASGRCRVHAALGTVLVATTDAGGSSGLVDSGDGTVHTDGEVVLTTVPACVVHGSLVDAVGRGIAGARVSARAHGSLGAARGRSIANIPTDAGGAFVLALDAVATYDLEARHGELTSETLQIDARALGRVSVRIRMIEAVEVRGDVRDPQGQPCAGASVRVRRADVDPGADPLAKPFDASVTADAEGAFRLPVPGPGRYAATASHDAHAPSAAIPIAVAGMDGADAVHLQLRAWVKMSGAVRWDDGGPVVGATLTARPGAGPRADDLEPRTVATGEDGSFAFAHLLGDLRYDLICVPDPALPHTHVVRASVWPSVQDFVLDREALRGASVRIRLTVPEGRRYESGTVLVSRLLPSGWARGDARELSFDATHVATIDGLVRDATYAVELRGVYSRCRTEPFVAGVDAERTLTLTSPGQVTVLVREADGTPALGATAILREDAPAGLRRDDATKRTDLTGRAHWESVSALRWLVLAARNGSEGEALRLLVEPGVEHRIEVRLR